MPRGIHLAASTAPAAGLGIRLLDYPADQAGDSRSHEYIVQTVTGGSTLTRHLRITNTTGSTQTVQLSTTAASIGSGAFKLTEAGQNQLSKWTSISTPTVVLPNGKSTTVTVTVAVPATATLGEQYAVVWAAMRAPARKDGSVSVVNRVGIREYVNVNTQNTAPTFEITRVASGRDSKYTPTVTANVTNTGSTAIDLTGQVTLAHGPGATNAGPYPTTQALTLAPGQHGRVVIRTAAALAAGPWTATVTLHSGSLSHAKTAQITFPHQARVSTESHAAVWIVSAGILVLLVLIAAGVIIAIRRHRRRNIRP